MCLRVPGCLTHCPRYMSAGARGWKGRRGWGGTEGREVGGKWRWVWGGAGLKAFSVTDMYRSNIPFMCAQLMHRPESLVQLGDLARARSTRGARRGEGARLCWAGAWLPTEREAGGGFWVGLPGVMSINQ